MRSVKGPFGCGTAMPRSTLGYRYVINGKDRYVRARWDGIVDYMEFWNVIDWLSILSGIYIALQWCRPGSRWRWGMPSRCVHQIGGGATSSTARRFCLGYFGERRTGSRSSLQWRSKIARPAVFLVGQAGLSHSA